MSVVGPVSGIGVVVSGGGGDELQSMAGGPTTSVASSVSEPPPSLMGVSNMANKFYPLDTLVNVYVDLVVFTRIAGTS